MIVFNIYEDEDSEEEFVDMMLHIAFPRRPKIFRKRVDYFTELRDNEFFDRFRLSKDAVLYVVNKIRSKIQSPTTRHVFNMKYSLPRLL